MSDATSKGREMNKLRIWLADLVTGGGYSIEKMTRENFEDAFFDMQKQRDEWCINWEEAEGKLQRIQAELESWKASQHYSYIGKDGKPRLARDMEDELDATKDKLAKAVEVLEYAKRLKEEAFKISCQLPQHSHSKHDIQEAADLFELKESEFNTLAEIKGE